MQNISLTSLLDQVLSVAAQFEDISFSHVKWQFNKIADELSKQAVLVQQGVLHVVEHVELEDPPVLYLSASLLSLLQLLYSLKITSHCWHRC